MHWHIHIHVSQSHPGIWCDLQMSQLGGFMVKLFGMSKMAAYGVSDI